MNHPTHLPGDVSYRWDGRTLTIETPAGACRLTGEEARALHDALGYVAAPAMLADVLAEYHVTDHTTTTGRIMDINSAMQLLAELISDEAPAEDVHTQIEDILEWLGKDGAMPERTYLVRLLKALEARHYAHDP